MHCSAELPHRLFWTTYLPPIVVEPNGSQIVVSAWAGTAPISGAAIVVAMVSSTADHKRLCLIESLSFGAIGSVPIYSAR
jgi:hypothetical protein